MTWNSLKITGIALVCIFLVIPLASADINTTSNIIPRKPIPLSISNISSDAAIQPNASTYENYELIMSMDHFQGFLTDWNEKMSWGLTPQQISSYSENLKQGVLIKYQPPTRAAICVSDIPTFCKDVGNAIGLSGEQSDRFAKTADDYYAQGRIAFHQESILKARLSETMLTQEGDLTTLAETQSAPYAYGLVDYTFIFVNFSDPSPVPPSATSENWNDVDIQNALGDAYLGAQAISNQSPQQAVMSNTWGYYDGILIDGANTDPLSSNGWMEQAVQQLGFDNTEALARYYLAETGADSEVIIYFTHDAQGAYAAGGLWGFADRAAVSYWGYYDPTQYQDESDFFSAVPNSYEHETVHLFGAIDEYEYPEGTTTCGANSSYADSPMKEMYSSTNAYNCVPYDPVTIMGMGMYDTTNIQQSAQHFIGWGDFDGDRTLDPRDRQPYDNLGSEIGVFQPSTQKFYLDTTGDGVWNTNDTLYTFGATGDLPISGDWNNDGTTEIGVFRGSTIKFYLDASGNGAWGSDDALYSFGATGDFPVAGDWNNNGYTEIGVFRNSTHKFYLDTTGDGVWNTGDTLYNFGNTDDLPLAGDWNNNGYTEIGVFRNSTHKFYLDTTGDGVWNTGDMLYTFGNIGDLPLAGDWNNDDTTEIGVFRNSTHKFYLDTTGDGVWNTGDMLYTFGYSGDKPVAGQWK